MLLLPLLIEAALSMSLAPQPILEKNVTDAWMANMAREVHSALVEAEQLETTMVTRAHPGSVQGGALLREATVKPGLMDSALDVFRGSLLPLEFGLGCRIALVLGDAGSRDTSYMCLWTDGAERADGASQPNGADTYEQLRSSQPRAAWTARDEAHARFAARFHEGEANEGFYPSRWHWLGESGRPGGGAIPLGAAGEAPVGALDGLVATKMMGLFHHGSLERGRHLFCDLLAPQLRSIPGAVAAASLHDPALDKLLMLMLWRSAADRIRGEAIVERAINVSGTLGPLLTEPLLVEAWPDAAVFWAARAGPAERTAAGGVERGGAGEEEALEAGAESGGGRVDDDEPDVIEVGGA